jgi:hypothetical protein
MKQQQSKKRGETKLDNTRLHKTSASIVVFWQGIALREAN